MSEHTFVITIRIDDDVVPTRDVPDPVMERLSEIGAYLATDLYEQWGPGADGGLEPPFVQVVAVCMDGELLGAMPPE